MISLNSEVPLTPCVQSPFRRVRDGSQVAIYCVSIEPKCSQCGFYWCDLLADSDVPFKRPHMPLRFTHQKSPRTSSSSPLSLFPLFLFLCCHAMSPAVVFFLHMSPYPSWRHPWVAIRCHFVPFLLHFLPVCPPFLHNNRTLSRFSQIPWATPAFSPSFSICLSVSSLPLCSAHLQHIKIPLFFLQRIVQSLGDLLHSSMFSLLFSPYLSPCLFVLAAHHCL